jgi:hypothetical protein
MKARTPEEWSELYEGKSRSKIEYSRGEEVLYQPDKGFFSFVLNPDDKCLECCKIVGDGKYWQAQIIAILKHLGWSRVRFFTKRNPEAWIRRYGGHIRGYYMEVDWDDVKI